MSTPRAHLGKRGEDLAQLYLVRQNYQVLTTNYRCRWGEVDIVAQEGSELVFVEVRTRRGHSFGTPEESITPNKAQHLVATAQQFIQERELEQVAWRIDLIGITMPPGTSSPDIQHLKHAVEL